MGAGLHHHKLPFGDGLQLVRRHQRPGNHLKGLAGVILPATDGAAHHRAVAQGLGQHLCRLAVGCKAAEDGVLHVVLDDLRTLLA